MDNSMLRTPLKVEQKLSAMKDYEAGVSVAEVCRKHNVNSNSLYKWKAKYEKAGVDGLAPKRVTSITSKESELQKENSELKSFWGRRN